MSKYYVHGFFQDFILHFMSLLTAPIASRNLAGIYLIFLKNVLDQTWKSFKIEFGPKQKYWKKSYQVWINLTLFYNLVALILGCYCVKGLMVAKIIKIWRGTEWVRGKKLFPEFQEKPFLPENFMSNKTN